MLTVNGGVLFDVVGLGAKKTFVLRFRGLVTAKKVEIENLFDAIGHKPTPFIPPSDVGGVIPSVNVTWANDQMELEWEATSVGGGQFILWGTTIMLREV